MGAKPVLGLGCRKGAKSEDLLLLAGQVLAMGGISATHLSAIATIESKATEPAILDVAAHYRVPLLVFSPERLEQETPRLANPSETVFRETGCHGVAEAAALAAAGNEAVLLVAKLKSGFGTAALAGE